jgi:hypothetical protein
MNDPFSPFEIHRAKTNIISALLLWQADEAAFFDHLIHFLRGNDREKKSQHTLAINRRSGWL